ncbi:MAG: PD-(D/E)XK nuclease family protein [Alphaproteobacteria bacterium]|nr:PD-(D/E)XK nuclease family protein [Alphaproteobacteria bacterium]
MPRLNKTVYSIPAGEPFLETLIAGLKKLSPYELQSAIILLPTRRACNTLRDKFMAQQSDGGAMLLPAIRQLSAIDEDELIVTADPELAQAVLAIPPAISPMRRRLLLTKLILSRKEPDVSHTQAFLLAGDLGHLLDQVLIENCDFKNLEPLVNGKELSAHWEKIVKFLSIITEVWPKILAEDGLIETVDRRKRLIELQIQHWQKKIPQHYVIAAGSTGSHPSTTQLLKAIAAMPKGAVILPGVDTVLDEPSWNALGPSHPQYLLKKLLKNLDVERGDVLTWGASSHELSPRAHFLSEVMRPAEFSEQWEGLHKTFADVTPLEGLQYLTAEHEQEEAMLVAIMLRETLEHPTKTAAMITPDRSLAMRVATILRRWNVVVDDSAGLPLSQTSLASFMTLLLKLPQSELKPSDLMAFLKHPLTSVGMPREACLRLARELEATFFRKQICGHGIATWKSLLPGDHTCAGLLQTLLEECSKLTNLHEDRPLLEWLELHPALASAWCRGSLWQGVEGEALSIYIDKLRANCSGYTCSFEDYIGIFTQGLRSETLRAHYGQHPRLHIFGLIEARMLSFDHIVLAGLNEGTWPEIPAQDPWMAPFMRVEFGLPNPDQHLGQTAHDFVQLAAQKKVTLLRSLRNGVTPTNPSRWLLRLQAILKMLDQMDALNPTTPWHEWVRAMDAVADITPCAAPEVKVPISAMPARISATDVELWIRDPYAYYAKNILRLRASNDLDAELTAMERGNIFHTVLDTLTTTYANTWPLTAQQTFIDLLADGFAKHGTSSDEWHVMLSRIKHLAEEVWKFEHDRRQKVISFHSEIKGETPLDMGDYQPILHAKADRVDVLRDGSLHITDYKTGEPPTKTMVESALKPQLLVESIIATNHGFKGIDASYVSMIGYVKIGEGEKLLDDKTPLPLAEDIVQAVHQPGLMNFIAAFLEKDALFHSTPRPSLLSPSPDYARLARVAEWSKGEIAQEDAG